MAELRPIPFARLLCRAHEERRRAHAVFDLPARKFYPGPVSGAAVDLSVAYAGARAATPFGPAAGPHTQLAQNIALCWLAGARIIELKTIQRNDRLTLSRPCIDMATIGYNTEWSQELRLDDSLAEYVKASMLIELLDADRVLGQPGGPTVFDISVGYDLDGIRSAEVTGWLGAMRDARPLVERFRQEIPAEFDNLRDLPFTTAISNSVTLSTFHGTPAGEIERIGEFLIGELGFHTVIKLNPPMLGRDRLEHILHDVLGYHAVRVNPDCYDRSLRFDEAVDLVGRLQALAARRGVTAGIKCGNTLEVLNTGTFLKERVQYLSGQPLHALHAALVSEWRKAAGAGLQISFSAGVDAANAASCVAAGLVPVTTCTDLLRAGGYGCLSRYLANLEARMRERGAATIEEFILAEAATGDRRQETGDRRQNQEDEKTRRREASTETPASDSAKQSLERAILANTGALLQQALTDPRYRAAHTGKAPRKLGTRLWLWDCLTCRKCIPVCPNDAMFEIDTEPFIGELPVIEVTADGWHEVDRVLYRALKTLQLVNFADACNDCGNCDVFCPEDGGPQIEKPRFFGSVEAWRDAAPLAGFVATREGAHVVMRGRFADGDRTLVYEPGAPTARFLAGAATAVIDWQTHAVLAAGLEGCATGPSAGVRVDLAQYLTLHILLDAVTRGSRVNFVTAGLAG